MGYSPWGHKELDTTERLHFTFTFPCKQALRGSWLRVTEREVNSGSGKEGRGMQEKGQGRGLVGGGLLLREPQSCRQNTSHHRPSERWELESLSTGSCPLLAEGVINIPTLLSCTAQ